MTFAFVAAVYVFGGLTFLPLLLAAVLIPAWYLLPHTSDEQGRTKKDGADQEQPSEAPSSPDGAASGTFAVLRSYNFPAANTALSTRNNHPSAGLESDGEVSAHSESVYQSMYRSVFDRGKSAAASNTVLEKEETPSSSNNARTRKSAVPVNVFHIVLRHGHLMLYDSAAQVEVRHVISMANHTISLSESGSEEDEALKDADLFIKRTAIVLTPVEYPNGQLQPRASAAKPFYLFSTTCSEKEDFYHALLYTRAKPPLPMPLEPNDAIKLQSALHSTSLTAETKALNAFIGRIFLALYRTDRVKDLIKRKVEKKISRVSKPAFIASLAVHSIDLGDASPMISNLKLKDFSITGDTTLSFDIRYDGGVRGTDGLQKRTGGIKLTISAMAKLDLGPRFKTRTVDLLLATSLQRLSGRMLVRVKPPPSNRIWFCFENMPEMDIRVEPIVSQRQITYSFVLRAIEERIRAVVGETLVKPNWDDAAFFDTRGQTVRGGIWQDEGSDIRLNEEIEEPKSLSKHAKTMSMPTLVGEADSSGTSSGSETASKMASGSSLTAQYLSDDLKRRSAASLPMRSGTNLSEADSTSTPQRTRPLRSPSFAKAATSAASVAVDGVTAEQVRARDLAAPPPRMWRMRTPQIKKEAMDAMREVRDRAYRSDGVATPQSTEDSQLQLDAEQTSLEAAGDDEEVSVRRSSDPSTPSSKPTGALASGTLRGPIRTNTKSSTTSTSSASSNSQQQRKTILAATAAATSAARNWSWNAINNARTANKTGNVSHARHASDEPIGRGQPLPPPGMPLPGPQKGGIFTGLGGGSMKRKPVPSSRNNASDNDESGRDQMSNNQGSPSLRVPTAEQLQDIAQSPVSDAEFGPWSENSGTVSDAHDTTRPPIEGEQVVATADDSVLDASELAPPNLPSRPQDDGKRKVPPPLPARRPKPSPDVVKEEQSAKLDDTLLTHPADVSDINSQSTGEANRLAHDVSTASATPQQLLDEETHGTAQGTSVESDVGEEQASREELELPDDDEEDAVIAVPAPVEDDDVEEAEPKESESVFEDGEADKDAHVELVKDTM